MRLSGDRRRRRLPRRDVVTQKQLDGLLYGLGRKIRELVVAPLEKRIAELEARQIKMAGVWKEGIAYEENSLVSFQGGLWLARAATSARPGSGSPAWRLAVKRGAAG